MAKNITVVKIRFKKHVKDDPKCVGYYDNGGWLVASTKLPKDCNETGDKYKYGKFVIKPK